MPHSVTIPLMVSNPAAAWTFWIAYAIWTVPEFLGGFRQRSSVTGATAQDRGSYFAVVFSMYAGLFIAFLAAIRVPTATITWQRGTVFALGIALMLLGIALRWWAIRTLGQFFTRDVATRGDQVVVENGPYRLIRHPSYSGTLLTVLGVGVALTNWVSIIVAVGCSLAGHLYRVRIEEAALRKALGKPYEDYVRRTRRFIPFVL
jgi:protein-S-isoprenylcysteine O-methyltransferase Ste14